jgi:hypothetical protein
LDAAIASSKAPFTYVEIGIGYGQTLNSVCDYVSQHGIEFLCHGVDVPAFVGKASVSASYSHPDNVRLHLVGSSAFLTNALVEGIRPDFIFIDGCHGCQCVVDDFLGAERIISPGGVVAFHDTDPGCQDIHHQPHCGTGIRARAAVAKLGLLDGIRTGWKKFDETSGNKGAGGHGCLFVQRTSD